MLPVQHLVTLYMTKTPTRNTCTPNSGGAHLPHRPWQDAPDGSRKPGDPRHHEEHQQDGQQVGAEDEGDAGQNDSTRRVGVVAYDCKTIKPVS